MIESFEWNNPNVRINRRKKMFLKSITHFPKISENWSTYYFLCFYLTSLKIIFSFFMMYWTYLSDLKVSICFKLPYYDEGFSYVIYDFNLIIVWIPKIIVSDSLIIQIWIKDSEKYIIWTRLINNHAYVHSWMQTGPC